MSGELQAADEEIYSAVCSLKAAVAALETIADKVQKKKAESDAKHQLKAVRSLVSHMRSLVRKCTDATQKTVFDKKRIDYDAELKVLNDTLSAASSSGSASHSKKKVKKTAAEKKIDELMGEGGEDGSGFENATQVLDAGRRVNQDAIESLQRANRLQDSAEQTGLATLQTLQKQTEVLYHIDEELQDLQGNLDRASRDIQWFARHMAGDKCFLVLFCIICLVLMIVVFWKIFNKRLNPPAPAAAPAVVAAPPATVAAAAGSQSYRHVMNMLMQDH